VSSIRLFDTTSGRVRLDLPGGALAFSPDGGTLAVTGWQCVQPIETEDAG